MQKAADAARQSGKRIGIVPTMGALHEGHLSLIRAAREHCDLAVMTLFVNPAQFAPTEDLASYPRTFEQDCTLAEREGAAIIFAPSASEMYLPDHEVYVAPEKLGSVLEGAVRPAHFRGVLTVVTKLFNIVRPHVAVFGQKDFQQAVLIKKMVRDLNFGIEVIVAPIVREPDGLAMSSRNIYLSPSERLQARALSESLKIAENIIDSGERSAQKIINVMNERIAPEPDASVDYITVLAPETLSQIEQLQQGSTVAIVLAVRVGKTRLLDNMLKHIQ